MTPIESFVDRYVEIDWVNRTIIVTPLPEDEEDFSIEELSIYLKAKLREGPDPLEILALTFKEDA